MIDELAREGARRMPAEALQAEVDDYIARHAGERDEHGRRLSCAMATISLARSVPRPGRSAATPRRSSGSGVVS